MEVEIIWVDSGVNAQETVKKTIVSKPSKNIPALII